MGTFTGNDNDNTITPTFVSGGVLAEPAWIISQRRPDTLVGNGGADTLDGGGGADDISGGGGNDTIILGPDGTFSGIRVVTFGDAGGISATLTDASGTGDNVRGRGSR